MTVRLDIVAFVGTLLILAGCHVGGAAPGHGNAHSASAPGSSGGQSCFISYNGRDRQMCEAYREGKSCFMAFKHSTDQGWCKHLKERKSCFTALDGLARDDCEVGRVPRDHEMWLSGGPRESR